MASSSSPSSLVLGPVPPGLSIVPLRVSRAGPDRIWIRSASLGAPPEKVLVDCRRLSEPDIIARGSAISKVRLAKYPQSVPSVVRLLKELGRGGEGRDGTDFEVFVAEVKPPPPLPRTPHPLETLLAVLSRAIRRRLSIPPFLSTDFGPRGECRVTYLPPPTLDPVPVLEFPPGSTLQGSLDEAIARYPLTHDNPPGHPSVVAELEGDDGEDDLDVVDPATLKFAARLLREAKNRNKE